MVVPALPPVPRSPLLQLPGAVAATGVDDGIAWHYGDPLGEQRSAQRSAVLLDRSHRGVVAVTGPDRLAWLHTLTSQHFADLLDGDVTQALVLDPQGHVEHHMVVTVLGDTVWLDTEPGAQHALADHLERMRFWSDVQVTDRTGDMALLAVTGPETGSVLARVDLEQPAPRHARPLPAGTGGWIRSTDRLDHAPEALVAHVDGSDGASEVVELLVPRGELAALAGRLTTAGARPAGSWTDDALRVLDRVPRWGVDIDDRTIPNEVRWIDTAVHLAKGCYRGQETVARVANLGRPPRRLVLLNLDGSMEQLPEPGAEVLSGNGRSVGRLGTVVHHHEDGPVALALVKRGVPAGTPLLAGGVDAMIDPVDVESAEGTPRSVVDRRAFSAVRRP